MGTGIAWNEGRRGRGAGWPHPGAPGTSVVSGRAHSPSLPGFPTLRPSARVSEWRSSKPAAGTRGGGSCGSPGREARGSGLCSPAHVAPPRSPARPRLCVGEQFLGLPRPCVWVPCLSCRPLRNTSGATPSSLWDRAQAATFRPPRDVEPPRIRSLRLRGPGRSGVTQPKRPVLAGLLFLCRQVAPWPPPDC